MCQKKSMHKNQTDIADENWYHVYLLLWLKYLIK